MAHHVFIPQFQIATCLFEQMEESQNFQDHNFRAEKIRSL